MTSFQVRVQPHQADTGSDHLLDWFEGSKRPSTVAYEPKFLHGLSPGPLARDLLRVGGAVFCADKVALRKAAADSWTRDIDVMVPVSEPDVWTAARPQLERALRYLSGDRWTFSFDEVLPEPDPSRRRRRRGQLALPVDGYSAVCLFSGGLDSLAGAIDLLEAGEKVLFVGHHESSKPGNLQGRLFNELQRAYGDEKSALRRLYLGVRGRTDLQARPLPPARERTTRSRSFLFIAAAVAVADAIASPARVVMPENGFIGINVPLTGARLGSLSTRTTHPFYVACIAELFAQLGLGHRIENPFRLKTKGEILQASSNSELLEQLAPTTISCSHPEAARWAGGEVGQRQGNCGVCYPCLIRGASLHRLGWVDGWRRYDPLHRGTLSMLLDPTKRTGASLRALLDHLRRDAAISDVLRNGPVPDGEARAFFKVHQRGRRELVSWLSSGNGPLHRGRR